MSLEQLAVVRRSLAALVTEEPRSLEELRASYDQAGLAFGMPDGVKVASVKAGGVPAEWIAPAAGGGKSVLLYLHGGGFALGSLDSHRHMAARIALALNGRVLLIHYRRAPEHPFPAAVDDAFAAYRWLIETGVDPKSLAVAGDSAGGGLTLATLVVARDAGLKMPAAAVCISPWANLENTGASYKEQADADPMVRHEDLERWTEVYLGKGVSRTAPLASPVHADLSGLPPVLIQTGGAEVLLSDSVLLAERLKQKGIPVDLDVWPGMIHVWHWFAPMLSEGQAAIDKMASFLKAKLG
ncbi:MAG: alpha/beta hydrolase [Alphaproteobacteria bacterium]|jgi:epsilon-lactone hydrolase|nr:alpha/beta hydrolase [Alphaproteobacteria bacterium]